MAFIGNGAQLTDLDAGDIASGTLPVARGGTGTSTPSLVGGTNVTISGTWPNQTVTAVGTAPTTAQVLSATAGATASGVGTYSFLTFNGSGQIIHNSNYAGSNLRRVAWRYLSENSGFSPATGTEGAAETGTWKYMCGISPSISYPGGIFLRVS